MLIGWGGYSKVWKPPRKNKVIEQKYRGNEDYIQRLTTETLKDILKGQYARTIFDKKNKMSSPLLAVYERPNQMYSQIRPFREENIKDLLVKNADKINLKLFCKILVNIRDIMKGLVLIHAKGLIHHDIKENNILYNTKPFKLFLIDWGTVELFDDVYAEKNSEWFSGDNTNLPPEYKSYAHYKYDYQFDQDDFAMDYANNVYLYAILKIQPNYMELLNKANQDLQKEFKRKGEAFMRQIAPKSDVFAMGVVLIRIYLLIAYEKLYGTSFDKKFVYLLKKMIHPDPRKRWTMKKALSHIKPLVYQICSFTN